MRSGTRSSDVWRSVAGEDVAATSEECIFRAANTRAGASRETVRRRCCSAASRAQGGGAQRGKTWMRREERASSGRRTRERERAAKPSVADAVLQRAERKVEERSGGTL